MATINDVIEAIENFELNIVEKQWSDDIWENDFTLCPDELPDEFADRFPPLDYYQIVQVIENADNIINKWMNENLSASSSSNNPELTNNDNGISWSSLQDVDYKKLLAILFYYISKGQAQNQDFNSVFICLKATNFYYTLLMIPGSDIYKLFNLSFFEKCLETFTLYKCLEIATGGKKIKKTKYRKNEAIIDEACSSINEALTLTQQQNIVRQLNILLSTFQLLVNKFNFKKYPEAVSMSLNYLADLTRVERTCTLQNYYSDNYDNSFAPLSRNAYLTMKAFCTNKHGRVAENIRLVLYYIMPNLTSIGGPTIPEFNRYNLRELNNIRNVAISFVTENIIPLGNDANLGLKILIQQICYNMVDRADYRPKATEMILAILSRLSSDFYYSILMWIFRLSMMDGAHHRVIGVEILSKLLYMKGPGTIEHSIVPELHTQSNVSDEPSSSNFRSALSSNLSQAALVSFAHPINHEPIAYRRAMLAIIIDRIRDEAAIVRTRALSVMADLLSNKTSQTVKFLLEEIFVNPRVRENVIDKNEENIFLNWKNFVAALDKVRERETTRNMIPNAKAILKKIFEKCLDDRVSVRKSALQVIMKIFMFSSKWMTNKNLELFGRHCRDPALSIRKDMVSYITELMLFFPVHEGIIKLWVKEVVPQITDREIRVQEQVLQVFTSTIISKIMSFENTKTAIDELPWKLLYYIGRMKMRNFLINACFLWKKLGCLTQTLIRKLETHIGTKNNNSSWLLISSISEFIDIDAPLFVHSYYFSNVSKVVGNVGVLNLSLNTLNNCWQKLDKKDQISLQQEMYRNIESLSVPSSLMSRTVEIAAAITIKLSENELEGKKKIANWVVGKIQELELHLVQCLGSLPRQCNKCIAVLSLLGNLGTVLPDKISNSTFTILHKFLMNTVNKCDEYTRKIRAIIVLTISKLALKNDSFARNLVSSLSKLLATASDPILLNNVIVAIADIGERFANLIEPLISSMCVCLKSEHKIIKEITLVLLIELLQEDYLKARGALVFHLLTLVNDSDPKTVNVVKYYFTNCLIPRHPYKMYELLLPSLFHFNNYTKHPDYPELEMADSEKLAFDVSGKVNHLKRMNIYQFMMSNVPEIVRIKCLHFICTVVLNGAADSVISVKNANGEQVVFDALSLLLTKEMKIDYNELVKRKNEENEEEDDQRQNPLYKLGRQMFSAAHKKEIIDNILPICCKFKKKLLQENRKLLPLLRKFVRELVRDYRDEINEMFKEDKQFGIEILHELECDDNMIEDDEDSENNENDEECLRENNITETEVAPLTETVTEQLDNEIADNAAHNSNEQLDTAMEQVDTAMEQVDTPMEQVDTPMEQVDTPMEQVDTPMEQVDTPMEQLDTAMEQLDTPMEQLDTPMEQLDTPIKHDTNLKSVESECANSTLNDPIRELEARLDKCSEPKKKISDIEKIKNANCTKQLVVRVERLSLKDYNFVENGRQNQKKEAVKDFTKQEEVLKRLSVTLERLSSKYLSFLGVNEEDYCSNKKKSSKRNNDIKIKRCSVRLERLTLKQLKDMNIVLNDKKFENVLKKSPRKMIMPQKKLNTKKRKKFDTRSNENINTPSLRGRKKYPVTSTPMLNFNTNPFCSDNISPVTDEQ